MKILRFLYSYVSGLLSSVALVCITSFFVIRFEVYPFLDINEFKSSGEFFIAAENLIFIVSIIIAPVILLISISVSRFMYKGKSVFLSICVALPFWLIVFTETTSSYLFLLISVVMIFVLDLLDRRKERLKEPGGH